MAGGGSAELRALERRVAELESMARQDVRDGLTLAEELQVLVRRVARLENLRRVEEELQAQTRGAEQQVTEKPKPKAKPRRRPRRPRGGTRDASQKAVK